MKELLAIADHTIRRLRIEKFRRLGGTDDSEFSSWTSFNDPARSEDISKLEDKLGVVLPDDYKEFLHITNGFRIDKSGSGQI